MEGRPVVALKEISFDPEEKKFSFTFRDGGEGALRIVHLDTDRFVMEATLAGNLPKDKPFAALRSMYITETNNDAAVSPGARRAIRAGARSISSITRAARPPSSGRAAMWPRATTPAPPIWCSPASRNKAITSAGSASIVGGARSRIERLKYNL